MPIFKRKTSKYEDELTQASQAIKTGNVPVEIKTQQPGKLLQILRIFLRQNNYSDDYTTSTDPDKKSIWLNKRR